MNETQRRIKAYKEALPGLRERVVAVALLLLMSAAMMTSASFAWLTISRRPELTGVNTTVAANGNLEIALATGDAKTAPGESKVGDSSTTEGQTVPGANITWGNLINLSDSSYGLENLTLRPAQLNMVSLLNSPLYGAMYGQDGRISQLTSNFAYTSWVPATPEKPGYFGIATQRGVRAISSTKVEAVGAEQIWLNMIDEADKLNLRAGSAYTSMASNPVYMQSLATMMGKYMSDRMDNDGTYANPECEVKDIQNLRDMYVQFLVAFDYEAQAMAALANLQLFLVKGEGNYTPFTKDMIYAATDGSLEADGVQIQISDLKQFIKDRNTIVSDLEKLETLSNSGTTLKWEDSGLNTIVNNLVNVGECTMGDGTKIKNIGASNAVNYISGTQEAIITNGILYNFEARTGAYIDVKGMVLKVSIKRSFINYKDKEVIADVHTSASNLGYTLYNNDLKHITDQNTGKYAGGVVTAMDTYGLAVDFWVRTNAASSYLKLEGNVLVESEDVRATGMDVNGNTVDLYTVNLTSTDENGESFSYPVDLYKGKRTATNEDGTTEEVDAWYRADTHALVTDEELGGETPIGKFITETTVIGYEGENRVWDPESNQFLTTDATTQGSGSCYVYYADTPEDQARSLELLKAFKVAFVSADGKLMATAEMDTEQFFAENGRVTVPLKLSTINSISLGLDIYGEEQYAITQLEQNVPMLITAIVYLDGTMLGNEDVLAASDIQGRLNIQFGSSQEMNPIRNEELENQEIHVSAVVDENSRSFDYDTHEGDMESTVRINVTGSTPKTVTAFFTRAISSTQGSREQEMRFEPDPDEEGVWVSSYKFKAPGNYILRTVELDGVPYDLENNVEERTVKITGFTIKSLQVSGANANNHLRILTADSSAAVTVDIQFATEDITKMPKTVQGRFTRSDGNAVNVNFVLNPTTQIWSGTANFVASGDYTMQYVLLDGKHVELTAPQYDENGTVTNKGMWYTADITLGMRVAVYTTSPHSFPYKPEEMTDNQKLLKMQVEIFDNSGERMESMTNVHLYYGVQEYSTESMHAELTWNGSYYVGEFKTLEAGPGEWRFMRLEAQGNRLTQATTYPVFSIANPEPPAYKEHNTAEYQFAPNNDATMTALISNSQAAKVQAFIVKDNGTQSGVWVTGTRGGQTATSDGTQANEWSFLVPQLDNAGNFVTENGNQDGRWKMTQLKLWNVYSSEGEYYSEESPLIITLSDSTNSAISLDDTNKTKVVVRTYIEFTEDKSTNFGVTTQTVDGQTVSTVTGTFMQTHQVTGLHVDIRDFEGKPIEGISDVNLKFEYVNGTSSSKGGYTSESLSNATEGATISVSLTADDSGTHFVQNANGTLVFAGEYYTYFSYKVGEYTYTHTNNPKPEIQGTKALLPKTPVFTVSSKNPTVTISSISSGSSTDRYYTSATPGEKEYNAMLTGAFNKKIDAYSAAVYMYFAETSNYDNEAVEIKYPTVTLGLEGIPTGHSGVTMVFGNAADSASACTFTFAAGKTTASSSQTAGNRIGGGVNGTYDYGAYVIGAGIDKYPVLYPAGVQTVTQITVKYNNATYIVSLSNAVTINNPLYPAYADFAVNNSTFTGTVPGRIYATPQADGTFSITLPGSQTWTEAKSSTKNEDFTVQSGYPTTRAVYTERSETTGSGCNATTTTYYTPYTETTTVSVASSSTTTWTRTWSITGWKVGGKTYAPGETVTVTGGQTIQAVVSYTDGAKTTTSSTTTRTVVEYTSAGSESTTKPSGSKVDSTTRKQTDVVS